MKASAEKSSSTPSKSSTHTTNQPFFAKAGIGDFFAPAVQMKMEVNKPGDKFEQEADKMAEKVMRMPAPIAVTDEKLQRAPDDKLQQQAADKFQKAPLKEDKLQRKGGEEIPAVNDQIQAAIVRKTSGGQPLPRDVRSDMEPRFNADFNNVRVHTDAESANLSNQLSAKAFTYRNHIFFASGQYQPSTPAGKQLLAHELTHTLQQGAVVRRQVAISNVRTPVVQRDLLNEVKNEIKGGLDSLANTLIPGYTLLNVILGKNIITDAPVSRSGTNIIEGYMNLIPVIGVILMRELRETNSLTEAGIWVEAKVKSFGINFNDIAKRLVMMWDEMSIWYGIDKNVQIFKKYFGSLFATLKAFSGVVSGKVQELRFEAALRLAGATQLLDAMKKNQAAFKRVVQDPSLILTYFMDAMKLGMNNFKNNFDAHFVSVIGQWLLGKAANLGVKMPAVFDAMGIFSLVSQLIGLTYVQLRAQIVEKLGPKGESFIARIEKGEELAEKTLDVIKDLQAKGAVALWDMVKSYLGNIKEMIVSKITALVSIEVIKSAVLKLVSMLNPASAIVQLVMGIYRVVKFFMDKWNTIKLVTNAILDSITKVALHDIKGAANSIEETMVKGIVLMIGFLTSILGIGDIVDKAIKMIKQFSGMVNEAIKMGIDWFVKTGKKLFDRLFVKKEKVEQAEPQGDKIEQANPGLNFKLTESFDMNGEPHTLYTEVKHGKLIVEMASAHRAGLREKAENAIAETKSDKVKKQLIEIIAWLDEAQFEIDHLIADKHEIQKAEEKALKLTHKASSRLIEISKVPPGLKSLDYVHNSKYVTSDGEKFVLKEEYRGAKKIRPKFYEDTDASHKKIVAELLKSEKVKYDINPHKFFISEAFHDDEKTANFNDPKMVKIEGDKAIIPITQASPDHYNPPIAQQWTDGNGNNTNQKSRINWNYDLKTYRLISKALNNKLGSGGVNYTHTVGTKFRGPNES